MDLVRTKGYAATRVEDICAAAGVSKGSFFHHFASKEDAAEAAAAQWATHVETLFGAAPFRAHPDPLQRLLGYVDFRMSILSTPVIGCGCFAATLVQEVHQTHPRLTAAAAVAIDAHGEDLAALAAEALASRGITTEWSAQSLADHVQAVVQGGLILAKAAGDPEPARRALAHLRRYLEQIFESSVPRSPL
ncbi:MAG: TetR/AcrR family transcriptional regulator [Phenylobacterium sp.]|uniref:TetR/AcrR family transcriptional regulator n=1 Tax=Phenylobacterium sp. TaxID=1871053 RepID=UPI001A45A678|nr:TetR/AcrR family transcriptional regulator [Phenylobacterium sp.]MBL8771758.1 TetR/AcrR family transcriptional regulator [Phenylobacterium sp.]